MKTLLILFAALLAFGLCACNSPESSTGNNTAPSTPLANSTVTPYQQPTANKHNTASPTPCVGTYIVPGANGAADEIHPCSDLDTGNTPLASVNKTGNTNKMSKANKASAADANN